MVFYGITTSSMRPECCFFHVRLTESESADLSLPFIHAMDDFLDSTPRSRYRNRYRYLLLRLYAAPVYSALADWDVECALKHLDAVGPSVVSHEDLHEDTLMEGEFAEDVIDLAGVENAPGAFNDVSQRCRLIFTNQKRLVFTQVGGTRRG